MHTLLILLPPSIDWTLFDQGWPSFLHEAERMPGLIRESVFQVHQNLSGQSPFARIYAFHFQDQPSLIQAMTSPAGNAASQIIHRISGGSAVIVTGDFKEDRLHSSSDQTSTHPRP